MRNSINGDETKVRRRSEVLVVTMVSLALAGTLTACSTTKSQPAATSSGGTSGGSSGIPASAFSDTTGLTPTSVTVGNVSTLAFGLFKGSLVDPVSKKIIAFKGGILQTQQVASGFFIGTNQTGKVIFAP